MSAATAGGVLAQLEELRQAVGEDPEGDRAVRTIIATVEAMADALRLSREAMEVAVKIDHPAFLGFALTLDKINAALAAFNANHPETPDSSFSGTPKDGEGRDREADRARFSDPAFNEWLDQGISDSGHIVWHAVGDVASAWAGWEARQFAGDAVLLAECCGREECGGECGNAWRGMGMYRKPKDDEQPATPAGGGGEPPAFRDILDAIEHCVSAADEGEDFAVSRPMLDALTTLGLLQKAGRGRWSVTTAGEQLAAYRSRLASTGSTPAPSAVPNCQHEPSHAAPWRCCKCGHRFDTARSAAPTQEPTNG